MSKSDERDENLKIAYNNYGDELLIQKKDYHKAEEYYKNPEIFMV